MNIPFNKPWFTGDEPGMLAQAAQSGHISGNGSFTRKCQHFFEERYGFGKTFLTSSCTDALEMAAILAGIKQGDEVICPSFAFVSTANAFVLRGAKMVLADSYENHPNIDADKIEGLITPKTKAIVVIHYAGVACDMDKIMALANTYNLFVIEDAAQAIDSYYKGKALGSIGHFAAFSFHETKNIISGEGGLLAVNDDRFTERAEIIWEKGTNRAAFFRGEVDKYRWVDIGSSFLPSDLIAAFLYAQLRSLEHIQIRRKEIWQKYHDGLIFLEEAGHFFLPNIPTYASNNAHLFYLLAQTNEQRNGLLSFLKKQGIHAVFHYLPLHTSPFYAEKHDGRKLNNSIRFSETLLRLPFFYELKDEEQEFVVGQIRRYFR
ncbi:MAG: dTDP-4-amino-4,6-dideoxygalactose transaminase [Bacteroidales bacterium]|nr:dTDP-4-amino-4,6-dideoxygalactose transaminase [Bacteroidales bacterium]MCF8456788.1 dTDP-4-amino-4,6-dideoxygalactose transaminase [Bacteroidales bacterium]